MNSSPDTFSRAYTRYLDFVAGLSPGIFWSYTRAAAILILSTIALGLSFRNLRDRIPAPSLIPLQAFVLVCTLLIAIQLPIPTVSMSASPRALIFTVASFAILVLPGRMAWLLTNEEGKRRTIAGAIYGTIAFFLIASIVFK